MIAAADESSNAIATMYYPLTHTIDTAAVDASVAVSEAVAPIGAAADAGPDPTQTNPEIERRLKLVQDQFELASGALRELELWIRLREPRIEDGNNFGVDVQTNVLRTVVGAKDFMVRTGAGLAAWHYHRGTAIGRMCASAEQTTVRKPRAADAPPPHFTHVVV